MTAASATGTDLASRARGRRRGGGDEIEGEASKKSRRRRAYAGAFRASPHKKLVKAGADIVHIRQPVCRFAVFDAAVGKGSIRIALAEPVRAGINLGNDARSALLVTPSLHPPYGKGRQDDCYCVLFFMPLSLFEAPNPIRQSSLGQARCPVQARAGACAPRSDASVAQAARSSRPPIIVQN